MALQDYLDQEIKKICPIHGISFGKLDDKSTWRFNFKKEATDEQRILALVYIEKFEWNEENQKKADEDRKIDQYKDDLSIKYCYQDYKKTQPDASFLDFIIYLEKLNS